MSILFNFFNKEKKQWFYLQVNDMFDGYLTPLAPSQLQENLTVLSLTGPRRVTLAITSLDYPPCIDNIFCLLI